MAEDPKPQTNSSSIGYRQPPAGFSKGQSGNPAGRPKGAKNRPRGQGERLRSLMLAEAYRPIKLSKDDGEEITLPIAQAVFRSLAEAAAKGEARAQAMFLKIVGATEDEVAAVEEMLYEAATETAAPEPVTIIHKIIDPDPKRMRK